MSCVSLRLLTPASVCTDVVGVDINLLDTVDVDVGNDIGGAGVMGVDIGGAGIMGVNTDGDRCSLRWGATAHRGFSLRSANRRWQMEGLPFVQGSCLV